MTDNKNTIIAIVLSAIVLIGWQYFVGMPQMERQRQEALRNSSSSHSNSRRPRARHRARARHHARARHRARPRPARRSPCPAPRRRPRRAQTRAAVIAASPRITVETPRMKGSIALKGARIDDLALMHYRETVDPTSPPIVPALAVGHRAPVLRRVRLGARPGLDRQGAGRRDRLDAGGRRPARARPSR